MNPKYDIRKPAFKTVITSKDFTMHWEILYFKNLMEMGHEELDSGDRKIRMCCRLNMHEGY